MTLGFRNHVFFALIRATKQKSIHIMLVMRDPGPPSQRIAFHVLQPFHRPLLSPIHTRLRDRFDCLFTEDHRAVIRFKPAVLVVSDKPDKHLRHRLPQTLIVHTRHGISQKNYVGLCLPLVDFVCVSSPWVEQDCIDHGWTPRLDFWHTGFVGSDPLFQPPTHPPERTAGKTLLIAPTFNPLLCTLNAIGADWIVPLRRQHPDLNIIIKPHPHTAKYNPRGWAIAQQLAKQPGVHLVNDTHSDIYPLLHRADVLMSDVSSVMFFFLALDRPVILVDNPQAPNDPSSYQPDGIEWTWRDFGPRISHGDQVVDALCRCLQKPGEYQTQRHLYANRIFGELRDGCAADRIAAKITALLQPSPADATWVDQAWSSRVHQQPLVHHLPYWMLSLWRRLQPGQTAFTR